MNRAMFSGVAGMKAHQTKMDTIGNNIANVNTYGYKSQRAVFSDIYYQTLRSASAGNANRGGINPSTVGYGSTLSGVQTQMSQSSMQNTGFGLDVAITGEGFLQVMDPDGNIFYTKAGMLDYDSNGYLTDINGNFVLGATSVDGQPGVQKIRLTNVGTVQPQKPQTETTINGIKYKVEASNATKYGNVSIAIASSESLPAGLKASATISSNGAITIQLNAFEKFNSMDELNDVINKAITEANGGVQHPAGTITITPSENVFGTDAQDGSWTGNATNKAPTMVANTGFFGGALDIANFTPGNPGAVTNSSNTAFTATENPEENTYTITTTINGETYTGKVSKQAAQGSEIKLNGNKNGSITLKVQDSKKLAAELEKVEQGEAQAQVTIKEGTYFLGGASIKAIDKNLSVSGPISFNVDNYTHANGAIEITATIDGKQFKGSGTAGGDVVLTHEETGETITMAIPSKETIAANLGKPSPTAGDLNNTARNHTYSAAAAKPESTEPLTGAQIAGVNFGVETGKITGMEDGAFGGGMTFVKTSSDFNGSGTVESANFYATYKEAAGGTPAAWNVTMEINGKEYTASISEDTAATTILLKSPDGDYIQVTNPGFDKMTKEFQKQFPGQEPQNGNTMNALTGGGSLTVTPSVPSRDLGLSSESLVLKGGTEGGAVTLDELSNIAIGTDGTVSVSHAALGTVAVGKISLANFANTSGLQAAGNNYFVQTANSGEPNLCDPGSDGSGALKSSALEMSNVDLSGEMADMITTQRGFQANSRIISVSDTMLEELINLKR